MDLPAQKALAAKYNNSNTGRNNDKKYFKGNCNRCGKYGHKSSDCRVNVKSKGDNLRTHSFNHNKSEQSANNNSRHSKVKEAFISSNQNSICHRIPDKAWIIDSGATRHMT
ncbi:hypothetical protein QE152_g25269 [Popillia japonica]|uniref:CCHC-type domain-containing protein n=1 Tax=Popillia japonica TaxID=7064 RepID=A0AAW1K249_POPJA